MAELKFRVVHNALISEKADRQVKYNSNGSEMGRQTERETRKLGDI